MGSLVEALIAAMGLMAGVMVILTSLGGGESLRENEEQKSQQAPRTIHPDGECFAA